MTCMNWLSRLSTRGIHGDTVDVQLQSRETGDTGDTKILLGYDDTEDTGTATGPCMGILRT